MTSQPSLVFPIGLGNQNQNYVPPGGVGYCDIYGGNSPQRLALKRFAKGFFQAAAAGAAADIIIPAGAVSLFTSGPGESGADAGFYQSTNGVKGNAANLTQAETNSNKTGALARSGELFKVVAIGVELMPVATFDATSHVIIGAQSAAYEQYIQRLVLAQTTMALSYEDDECASELGLIGDYPDMGGAAGHSSIVTVGNPLAGALVPLPFPFFAGGRNSSDQITVTLTVQHELHVASGTGGGGATVAEMFNVPVKVSMYGVNYCKQLARPMFDSQNA